MLDIFFLILSFLTTFFMVGFVLIEIFYSKIIFRIKFPLYIITSLVFSTFILYLLALFFGFSRLLVLVTCLSFIPISVYFFIKLKANFIHYFIFNYKALVVTTFIVLVYLFALYPAILGKKDDYLVMSGVNWQDTALHLSITQSLTQGNFPPQAPYFSGTPLSYYYFTDFHSAIIAVAYGRFFPRVFVYDNALLVGTLVIVIYSLAYELSRNRKLSLISSIIGSFYGSFIFYKFFLTTINGQNPVEVLANNIYSMEYKQLFGMANIADYYLQNRPMMIGLPVVVLLVLLTIYIFKKRSLSLVFLTGLLSASLIKIQFFCILAVIISFVIISISNIRNIKIKFILQSYILYFVTITVSYLIIGIRSVNNSDLLGLISNSFHFGPWDNTKSIFWYLEFILLNLGLPFVVTAVSLIISIKRKIKTISVLGLLFVTIPLLVSFTIDGSDMLKFFYFSIIIFSVVTPFVLSRIIKNKYLFNTAITLIVFTTSISSILTLTNSYLNKNLGYTIPEYNSGLWIRNNTPLKSVFVTTTSVHSAPTDLGGRLRVISYTNWPYTHGYNMGFDNVFSRAEDVNRVYDTGDVSQVKLKYNANYIFYGGEERSQFPEAWKLFDLEHNLKLIYDLDDIKIYQII